MNQKDLAKAIGKKPQYINALIAGRRNAGFNLACKLEDITGISKLLWMTPWVSRKTEWKQFIKNQKEAV